MASYKVLQDIEAEDKLIGPLTLRQSIYAGIAVLAGYFSFLALTKHAGFLVIVFLPFVAFGAFFAFPWSKQQSTEVWALAKIRFFLKPRRRIWDQSGVKELVTVTAPKKLERIYTNGLSQNEVSSRLQALAETIDSRGWAVRSANLNLPARGALAYGGSSDRLIDIDNIPQEVPSYDVQASDDILDEYNSPLAQQFDQMINAATAAHRQALVQKMSQASASAQTPNTAPATPADYWFVQPAGTDAAAVAAPSQPVAPSAVGSETVETTEEARLSAQLRSQRQAAPAAYRNLRTIQPTLGAVPTAPVSPVQPGGTSSTLPDSAIIELARNNDHTVATLAREANQLNEVVVPLRRS